MMTSKTIYTYKIMHQAGTTLLEAQQWPWTVVQIIPVPAGQLDTVLAKLKDGMAGPVVQHDKDKSFVVIMLCAGDQGGKYPERHLELTQDNHMEHYNAIIDTMAQAAVWNKNQHYRQREKSLIIDPSKYHRKMKTIEQQYPELARLMAALNTTTLFRAEIDPGATEDPYDDNGGRMQCSVWVKSTDGRASWSVWFDAEGVATHPYEIHFMPATADGLGVDEDKYQEYTADTPCAVLLCILEDWQTIGQ